jgi:hypothetical protein
MIAGNQNPSNVERSFGACLLWLIFYGFFGFMVLMVVLHFVHKYADAEELRQRRAIMDEQIKAIKTGEVDCLVHPDPLFIDIILADAYCANNIHDLYLGGDISDDRLAQLRELPNLKCIIFLRAENPDEFLKCIRGTTSIEALSLTMTHISRIGVDAIAGLPNLKSLCIPISGLKSTDLEGLKNHLVLEHVFLTEAEPDENLIPILQSLPKLRSVTIHFGSNCGNYEQLLQEALPDCECTVQGMMGR